MTSTTVQRLEMDVAAFNSLSPILLYRAWQTLVGIGVRESLNTGITFDSAVKKFSIKNKSMFHCLLSYLIGNSVLRLENGKYFFNTLPKQPKIDDYLFLYNNYGKSMIWLENVTAMAPGVLLTGNPVNLMGFDSDSNFELWEDIMSESPYSFRQFTIEKILANVPEGASILDFGCGGGIAIEQFANTTKKKITITGVDLSKYYLNKAKERLKKIKSKSHGNVKNIQLREYNFLTDKEMDQKFDGIFMSLVLNHLSDSQHKLLIAILKPLLKKDGIIGIYQIVNQSEVNRSPLCWVMHVIPSHKCYPNKDNFTKLLHSNFESVEEHFAGNVLIVRKPTLKK